MLKKGVSTSIWIWITGGLTVALLTFTMTFQSLVSVGETSQRNEMVDQYNNLRNTADLYCSKSRGSLTTQSVSLSGVRGIYASDTKKNPPATIPENISDSDGRTGNYLCLKFEGEEKPYSCREMSCEVNMTYIGTPIDGSDMYVLGEDTPGFNFDLTIKKEKSGFINIKAKHMP